MGTDEIKSEINNQPVMANEKKERLRLAVELLLDDYLNDPELTAFSILDGEDFYEAK